VSRAAEIVEATIAQRIVPIVRTDSADSALAQCRIFVDAGFRVIEVTLTTPGALELIALLAEDRSLVIGAGSVLDEAQLGQAVEAGASFVVSPVLTDWFIPLAHQLGVAALPGAATPGEAFRAATAGADLVKIFPARRLGGAEFIRDILAPMPALPLMATGGISVADAPAMLGAGCLAVGVGSILQGGRPGDDPVSRARHALESVGGTIAYRRAVSAARE